jgi:nicotinamide-nucleotide amidase
VISPAKQGRRGCCTSRQNPRPARNGRLRFAPGNEAGETVIISKIAALKTPREWAFALFSEQQLSDAARFLTLCHSAGHKIATAESCTGGLLASLITSIPGSSDVFERGFVTYSNAAKIECLGVLREVLEAFGAVSREAALAMAEGALAHSNATLALSITGIAGPGGGTPQKPVGLVHFGFARIGCPTSAFEKRFGDIGRSAVRASAITAALTLLSDGLG